MIAALEDGQQDHLLELTEKSVGCHALHSSRYTVMVYIVDRNTVHFVDPLDKDELAGVGVSVGVERVRTEGGSGAYYRRRRCWF